MGKSNIRESGWPFAMAFGVAVIAAAWTIVVVDKLYLREWPSVPQASASPMFDYSSNRCGSRPEGGSSFRECGIIRDQKQQWFRLDHLNLTGLEAENLQLRDFLFNSLQSSMPMSKAFPTIQI